MLKRNQETSQSAIDSLLDRIWEAGILSPSEMGKVIDRKSDLTQLSYELFRYNVSLKCYRDPYSGEDLTIEEIARTLAVNAIGTNFPHGFLEMVNDFTQQCLDVRGVTRVTSD